MPPALRALWMSLGISLVIHVLVVALMPRSANRSPTPASLRVRLSIPAPPSLSPAPAIPAPPSDQRPDARQHASPVLAANAPMPREAAVPPPPTVDVQAALATARSIGKTWTAPREPGIPPRPPATVETVIARAVRPDTLIEERDAAGNWVQRSGGRRCVVALLNVPHYMRGMLIVPQCDVSKS